MQSRRDKNECAACGAKPVAAAAEGAACALCLARVCAAALARWSDWFAGEPPAQPQVPSESFDAEAHSDLADAYGEMKLERDALHESALAIAGSAKLAAGHGKRILESLTPLGWMLLRQLSPPN
jgi:hypothetical protein